VVVDWWKRQQPGGLIDWSKEPHCTEQDRTYSRQRIASKRRFGSVGCRHHRRFPPVCSVDRPESTVFFFVASFHESDRCRTMKIAWFLCSPSMQDSDWFACGLHAQSAVASARFNLVSRENSGYIEVDYGSESTIGGSPIDDVVFMIQL
jgi:hypothetical protein